MKKPSVDILLEGSMKTLSENKYLARTTITLIRGRNNIIVDTGNLGQDGEIVDALRRHALAPADIDCVILTHLCPDHNQNNFLFKNAIFIVGTSKYGFGDEYYVWQGDSYKVEEGVMVERMPGHSPYDVTVFVETEGGVVAVAGDLFFWKGDYDYSAAFAWDVEKFKQNREIIISRTKYIVPGHGPMFEVVR